MAANVLNSPKAIQMSVALITAFIRLREALAGNQAMAKRLVEIEITVLTHDAALRDLYQKDSPPLAPPARPTTPQDRIQPGHCPFLRVACITLCSFMVYDLVC